MLPCAFLVFALHASVRPPVPPPPPTSEIIVAERFIHLPHLPESVAKAHESYDQIRTGLTEGLKDLERMLRTLYACPDAGIPLPLSYKATKENAEEVRFLASVVSEKRYKDLEEPFFLAWEEWQAVLIENGLSHPLQSSTPTTPPTLAREVENKNLQMRIKGTRKSERAFMAEHKIRVSALTKPGKKGESVTDWKSVAEFDDASRGYEERVVTTQATVATANRHAPTLSAAWTPLADRLNADALQLANLESARKAALDPEIQPLRIQARIHFLERFRAALWSSNVVWAQMTSNVPPAPLKELNPLAAPEGQAEKTSSETSAR